MNGPTHQLVANLALACLSKEERHILSPRWGGIEAGSTLSDEFKIMWEPEDLGSKKRQLVHRCYIDSKDSKDHGCVTRAWDHAVGSVGFIQDYLRTDGCQGYTENEFLENLGMFLGIVCHHIGDLSTPVHVGHKMDYLKAGSRSRSAFHRKVEHDIVRLTPQASIQLCKPRKVTLSKKYFLSIAKETYSQLFLNLEEIYRSDDSNGKLDMASTVISRSVKHTADVWHTILLETGMCDRKWSMQPLL